MQPYFQTTQFTTAASSLLSVLHHLDPEVKLSKENEFAIWQSSINLPTRASSFFGLANYAWQKGFLVSLVVEKTDYSFPDYRFYRYTKEDIEHAAFSHNNHLAKTKELGIPLVEREISLEDVKEELQKNNLLLIRINAKHLRSLKRNTSNYVILAGFTAGYYHLLDPIIGGLSVPEKIMQEAFSSLEEKKYRDHRMIIFKR